MWGAFISEVTSIVMVVLDLDTFFGGEDDLAGEQIGHLEVANFTTDVDDALSSHFNWTGKAIAGIGLSLSPDNLRVNNGTFFMRGDLELKEKKMAANVIWPAANKDIYLLLTFPRADVFQFEEGGLWSSVVSASQFPHKFYDSTEGRGARAIISTDDRLEGTEAGFSVRMVTQVSSQSNAAKGVVMKCAIMLYPAKVEEVVEAAESRFAGWPGLKIAEIFVPLGPYPTVKWQCPVLPFVQPVQEFAEDDVAPTSYKLREAISAIMRNAKTHDGLKSGQDVLTKWAQIRVNPKTMMDKTPAVTWPHIRTPMEEELTGE
jgi:hypothetical protein